MKYYLVNYRDAVSSDDVSKLFGDRQHYPLRVDYIDELPDYINRYDREALPLNGWRFIIHNSMRQFILEDKVSDSSINMKDREIFRLIYERKAKTKEYISKL